MKEFKFALKRFLLIVFAYIFVGITFGLLMKEAGYGSIWSLLSSVMIYGGSMQFVLIGLLREHAPIYSIALVSLFINSRHMFYGLTYIDEFKEIRKQSFFKFLYLSFTLTDEVYSLYTTAEFPKKMDKIKIMMWISSLAYGTWILSSVVGSFAFDLINFNLIGLDFIITEFFGLIVISQLINNKSYIPTTVGITCSVLAFFAVGKNFILLAIVFSMACLMILKNKLNRGDING